MSKLPVSVIHYGRHDPRTKIGGVETFARNLDRIFESVDFMTPENIDVDLVVRGRQLVICDNHFVTDWPDQIPVVGFQHGVAAVKYDLTRKRADRTSARGQAAAANRPNTLWVSCAQWISDTFEHLHGNGAKHVVYHQVDIDKFDGIRNNVDRKLILHDARTEHKGKRLVARLQKKFASWKFEPLACKPIEVADRMRSAAAFLHLSRYEGNSIVCNEAMAMDMPCMFTTVGLMKDADGPTDVFRIDPDIAFGPKRGLVELFDEFITSLETRTYHPRTWTMAHASTDVHLAAWRNVVDEFVEMSGWELETQSRL